MTTNKTPTNTQTIRKKTLILFQTCDVTKMFVYFNVSFKQFNATKSVITNKTTMEGRIDENFNDPIEF